MESWPYYLCTQFVQNLSIIAVCIPYIRSSLLGLESGMLQTGNFRLHKISTLPTKFGTRVPPSSQWQKDASAGTSQHIQPTTQNVFPEQACNTTVVESAAENADWDGASQSSQSNIIRRTTEWLRAALNLQSIVVMKLFAQHIHHNYALLDNRVKPLHSSRTTMRFSPNPASQNLSPFCRSTLTDSPGSSGRASHLHSHDCHRSRNHDSRAPRSHIHRLRNRLLRRNLAICVRPLRLLLHPLRLPPLAPHHRQNPRPPRRRRRLLRCSYPPPSRCLTPGDSKRRGSPWRRRRQQSQ